MTNRYARAFAESRVITDQLSSASALRQDRKRELFRIEPKRFLIALGDIVGLTLSFGLTLVLLGRYFSDWSFGLEIQNLLFLLPSFMILMTWLGGYKPLEYRRSETEIQISFKAVTMSFLLLSAINFVLFKTSSSRYFSAIWFLQMLIFVPMFRFSVRGTFKFLWARGIGQQRTLAIGSRRLIDEMQSYLSIQKYSGCDLVGSIIDGSVDQDPRSSQGKTLDDLRTVIDELRIDLLIIAMDEFSQTVHEKILYILALAAELRMPVKIYSDVFNFANQRCELDEFSGLFVFPSLENSLNCVIHRAAKLCMDFVIGIIGSVVTLLMCPFVALLIYLDDPGPIFFRQQYVASKQRCGHYLKFRSMKVNADRILEQDPALKSMFEEKFKLVDDPRVTRVGRFLRKYSLDEFPEFFSVLAGTMSFVGPRTISEREADRYGDKLEKLLSVKPGLTGFWQVMGRQKTSYEERVRMDMFYIDRWSIWIDLYVACKTFSKVLKGDGAH